MWSKDSENTARHIAFDEKGLGIFDSLLICIGVGIMIGILFPYYHTYVKSSREAALQAGLANIRMSIEVYRTLQGHNPANLRSLVHERYLLPVREDTFFSAEYLRGQGEDREGNLLDPFGSPYRYDSNRGAVTSGTSGYEKW